MSGHVAEPKRWIDLSDDPMADVVIERRAAVVAQARRPLVDDRVEHILQLVRGRKVLDVGVVDHTSLSDRQAHWLHGAIAGAAGDCLGVDVVADEVAKLQARGFNVRLHDVTKVPLDERFDVIVCGEVIEHLDRPGDLFAAAATMLLPGGRLVLTTPNPFAVWRTWQGIKGRLRDNADHVSLISAWGIAEFAERHGLKLDTFRGVRYRGPGWKARLVSIDRVRRILGFVPESCAETIIYECVRQA